jgi:hypothetical protein
LPKASASNFTRLASILVDEVLAASICAGSVVFTE